MKKEFNSKTEVVEATATLESIPRDRQVGNSGSLAQFVKKILRVRETAMVLLILATMFIMSLFSPYFFSLTNFAAIARGFSMEGLVVIGMSLLLVAGKFDLSVGSVMALSGIVSAWLMVRVGLPMTVSAAGGLLVGSLAGLVNGLVVTRLKVNPLIATLGMMSIARGMALGFTEGRPVINVPMEYAWLGQGNLAGIPVPFLIMLIVVLIVDILLRRGRLLRQLYYIGGNEKAANLTGISVDRVVLLTFAASGFFAAMGGIISMARLQSGVPTAFVGVELRIIAACVIGGMSLSGGEGTIVGAVLGLIFMALVANAMTLFGVSIYWEGVVTGSILVVAVSLDMISRQRLRYKN
jgi:ribose transport system permease protein